MSERSAPPGIATFALGTKSLPDVGVAEGGGGTRPFDYLAEPSEKRTGIACSGGGIRSASFALGGLQVLRTKGVLNQAEHLACVSGGGYISIAHAVLVSETLKSGPLQQHLRHLERETRKGLIEAGDAGDEADRATALVRGSLEFTIAEILAEGEPQESPRPERKLKRALKETLKGANWSEEKVDHLLCLIEGTLTKIAKELSDPKLAEAGFGLLAPYAPGSP
jgi:hypothetical protein